MTEDEAKTKVCPFRAMWGETRNGDSYYNDGFCIASDCMMYRTTGEKKYLDRGKLYDKNLTDTGEWIDVGGYCGLTNKP